MTKTIARLFENPEFKLRKIDGTKMETNRY